MKTYKFPYSISFGMDSNGKGWLEYELTDEEAERLKKSAGEASGCKLNEDAQISDIYEKVLAAVIRQDIVDIVAEGESLMDILEEFGDEENGEYVIEDAVGRYAQQHLDFLNVRVYYPEVLKRE